MMEGWRLREKEREGEWERERERERLGGARGFATFLGLWEWRGGDGGWMGTISSWEVWSIAKDLRGVQGTDRGRGRRWMEGAEMCMLWRGSMDLRLEGEVRPLGAAGAAPWGNDLDRAFAT